MLYHKIYAPWKRDKATKKLTMEPVDATAQQMVETGWWFNFTEKINGANCRIDYNGFDVQIGAREVEDLSKTKWSDDAQAYLLGTFTEELFEEHYGKKKMIFFGELAGPGIGVEGSGKYFSETKFLLFDVFVPDDHPHGGWWLERDGVESIAKTWEIEKAPLVFTSNLVDARAVVADGLKSSYGDFVAEGVVGRPYGGIFNRKGERVIYKLKGVDFE